MNINTRNLSFVNFNDEEMQWVKFNGNIVYEAWKKIIKSGIPPLSIFAKGEDLINYKIYGNTDGVGNQTVNLYDKENYPLSAGYIYHGGGSFYGGSTSNYKATQDYIPIKPNTTYSINYTAGGGNPGIAWYDEDYKYLDGIKNGVDFTTSDGAKYLRFSVNKDVDIDTIQLNEGPTILPFEEYGFRIPIKSNDVEKEIFLKKPLKANDYIDYENQLVVIDGVETYMEIPNIPTTKGTTVIEVDTNIQPSNMEVTYKGKGE